MFKSKIIFSLIILNLFNGFSYAMNQDDQSQFSYANNMNRSLIRNSASNSSQTEENQITHIPTIIPIHVEDSVQEQEITTTVSIPTRCCGYLARCGTIACTTFIGGLIGFGIVSGEINPEVAYTLLKLGSPILIGSLIGYGIGWIGGNSIKARITGRC